MKFQHLIISRFNLSLYDSISKEDANHWMDYRIALFDSFCYPSIVNQINQNFIWLILFSHKTPKWHRDWFSGYKQLIPVCCYEQGFDDIQHIVMAVRPFINPNAEYIITSRVDVDDMLSKDYVQGVQTEMPMEDNIHLVFSLGYILDLSSKTLIERKYVNNQFPSYIEKNSDNLKTVWFTGHHLIHKLAKTKIVEQGRRWCWILHDKNKHPGSILKNYKGQIVDMKWLQNQFVYKRK